MDIDVVTGACVVVATVLVVWVVVAGWVEGVVGAWEVTASVGAAVVGARVDGVAEVGA